MSYAVAYALSIANNPGSATVTQSRFRLRWIDLVRPDGYWPQPYSIEQALCAYQWLVKTGAEFYEYGRPGPAELLSKKPTCLGKTSPDALRSIEDLRARFHYALLSNHVNDVQEAWRKQFSIDTNSEQRITCLHHKPFVGDRSEGDWKRSYEKILGASGTIETQLNPYHPRAKEVVGVRLHVSPTAFMFVLRYGYEGSVWEHELARSVKGECLNDSLLRAWQELERLGYREVGS